MSEILDQKLGSNAELKVEFTGGKAVLTISEKDSLGETSLVRTLDAGYLIDKIGEAIPGDWDKVPLEALKVLIKSL